MKQNTVQEIFQKFYLPYLDTHPVSYQQQKAANAILSCKTSLRGGHRSTCPNCGYTKIHYNSCGNRNCPMCQELPKEKWIDKKKEDILNIPYHHVVFTLPKELNRILYQNQERMYELLFQSASESLKELFRDHKYGGGESGFLCVLHTWGQELNYHPHLHCIVMGGILQTGGRFRTLEGKWLLPVKVLSKKFRGKFLFGLKELEKDLKLWNQGKNCHGEIETIRKTVWEKEWLVYIKPAFGNGYHVLNYLGRYTHRIAISNHRISGIGASQVSFLAKDYRNENRRKVVSVPGEEFIRRFLMHVVPKGFVRIRAYGLMSNRNRKRLTICRHQLNQKGYKSRIKEKNTEELLFLLYGLNVRQCPCCQSRGLQIRALPEYYSRDRP